MLMTVDGMRIENDQELVRRFAAARDEAAFAALVERYAAMVRASCQRRLRDPSLADDATQAVFLVLARRSRSLTRRSWRARPVVADWLLRTAALVCRDLDRQRRRRRRHEQASVAVQPTVVEPEAEQRDLVADAVDALPARYRQVVVLHYFAGLDRAAVGSELGLTSDAVDKRLQRAHAQLERRLRTVPVLTTLAAIRPPDDSGAFLHAAITHPTAAASAAATHIVHATWVWAAGSALALTAATAALIGLVASEPTTPATPRAAAGDPAAASPAGSIRIDHGGDDWASAVLVLPDRRLLVSGVGGAEGRRRVFVTRLLANGTVDTSYGDGGTAWCSEPSTGAWAFDLVALNGDRVASALATTGADGRRQLWLHVLDDQGRPERPAIDLFRWTSQRERMDGVRVRTTGDRGEDGGDRVWLATTWLEGDAQVPADARPVRTELSRMDFSTQKTMLETRVQLKSTAGDLYVTGAPAVWPDRRAVVPLGLVRDGGERIAIAGIPPSIFTAGARDPEVGFGTDGVWIPTITAAGMHDSFAKSRAAAVLAMPDGTYRIAGEARIETGALGALVVRCAGDDVDSPSEQRPNIYHAQSDDGTRMGFHALAAASDGYLAIGTAGEGESRRLIMAAFAADGTVLPWHAVPRTSGSGEDGYAAAVDGAGVVIVGATGVEGQRDVLVVRMSRAAEMDRTFSGVGAPANASAGSPGEF